MKPAPKRPSAAFLLPAVFAALHVAYGLGSLTGAFTLPFSVRKRKMLHTLYSAGDPGTAEPAKFN
jgi:hypothetical protein